MSFLTWTTESDCTDSLTALNAVYSCSYVLGDGYKMDQWAFSSKSAVSETWGFASPQLRPGIIMDDLMDSLTPGYIEYDDIPAGWFPDPEL